MLGKQAEIQNLAREILKEQYLDLRVDTYDMTERFETGRCTMHCELHCETSHERYVIDGEGVGIVDAFFNGAMRTLGEEYPSLKSIEFEDFRVEPRMETRHQKSGTDSKAEIVLRVRNSQGNRFEFRSSSRSLTRSSVEVTLQAIDYFVNSERAYVTTYHALQHAKQQNRQDSVQQYTARLVQLLDNTSYSEAIERLRKSM